MIVMSDHSQTAVETAVNLADVLRRPAGATPDRSGADRGRGRRLPSARSAMVYVLDDGAARRARRAARPTAARGRRRGLVITREDGEAVVRSAAASSASRPGADLPDRRGGGWAWSGDEAVLELDAGRRARDERHLSRRPRPALVGARCPHSGDVLVSAELGYEFVDWGGADHVGGGSHGSLHRGDSRACCCSAGGACPSASSGRSPTWPRWCSGTSVYLGAGDRRGERGHRRPPAAVHLRVRAGLRRPAQLGAALQVLRRRRLRLRRQPVRVRRLRRAARRAPPGRRHGRVRRGGAEQLLVEPPLDVPRPRRPRRLPGGALLHGQRRGVPVRRRRCSSCWSASPACRRSRRRRSRSSPPRRSTSSGTRCGASASSCRATAALGAARTLRAPALPGRGRGAATWSAAVADEAAARLRAQRARGRADRRRAPRRSRTRAGTGRSSRPPTRRAPGAGR